MAGRQKTDYSYKIVETIGSISEPNDKTNWCKAVLKTLLNEDEEGVDIRRADLQKKTMGSSGIRLTDTETHNLVDLLLQSGYGSYSVLEEVYNERKGLFYNTEEKKDN